MRDPRGGGRETSQMEWLSRATIVLLPLMVLGCVVAPMPVVEVPPVPPPGMVEMVPAAPGPAYAWVPGYWGWRPPRGYVWLPGRYALPPGAGYVWMPGYWAPSIGGHVWIGGHWRIR